MWLDVRGSIVARRDTRGRDRYWVVIEETTAQGWRRRRWHADPATGSAFTSKRAAENHAAALVAGAAAGGYVAPSRLLLGDWLDTWLATRTCWTAWRCPRRNAARIASLRRLIEALDFEIDLFAGLVRARLAQDPGYRAVQTIPGIGPTLGAVLVAEIGDVTRFARPEQLTCWAGLTPTHRESDTHVHRGRITKQGSRLVRWAAIESVQILPKTSHVGQIRDRIGAKRGRNIGAVAAARRQLEYVYYALRDHHVRALDTHPAAA